MGSLFSDMLEAWSEVAVTFEDYMHDNMGAPAEQLYLEHGMVTVLVREYMHRVPQHQREIQLGTRHYGSAVFNGFIDGLMPNGDLLENKLKSQWTDKDQQALLLDDQITCYIAHWALENGDEPKDITLQYHVTRKPALRQKVNETTDQFLVRIEDDILSRPEHYFIEVPTVYTKRSNEQVEEWLKETSLLGSFMTKAARVEEWPRNTGACLQYGSLCEMFPICSANEDEIKSIVDSKYKER